MDKWVYQNAPEGTEMQTPSHGGCLYWGSYTRMALHQVKVSKIATAHSTLDFTGMIDLEGCHNVAPIFTEDRISARQGGC